MAEFFSKRDREKKKQQAKKEKEERKRERKEQARDGNSLSEMIAYLDENGNLTSTPPEDRIQEEKFEEGVVTYFNEE
jgi:hypothetical protein